MARKMQQLKDFKAHNVCDGADIANDDLGDPDDLRYELDDRLVGEIDIDIKEGAQEIPVYPDAKEQNQGLGALPREHDAKHEIRGLFFVSSS